MQNASRQSALPPAVKLISGFKTLEECLPAAALAILKLDKKCVRLCACVCALNFLPPVLRSSTHRERNVQRSVMSSSNATFLCCSNRLSFINFIVTNFLCLYQEMELPCALEMVKVEDEICCVASGEESPWLAAWPGLASAHILEHSERY